MANMARFLLSPLGWGFALCLSWNSLSAAQAQASTPNGSGPISNALTSPADNERLSDWLLRQDPLGLEDTTALVWQVPSERNAQAASKRALLAELSQSSGFSQIAKARWRALIESLPVTGRVRVTLPDARWLQAHPEQDPVLHKDHVLLLPRRANTVSVLSQEGAICTLRHQAGAQARDYLRACDDGVVGQIDHAWLIQPDGLVQEVALNHWNAKNQGELAPGALIWAPTVDKKTLGKLPQILPAFLATQAYEQVLGAQGLVRLDVASATVQPSAHQARSLPVTYNDWGIVGLLQTPTARMAEAGDMRFNYSRVSPYERYNVFVQPFDSLEAGFRYTNIVNRLYGPAELSGAQTYKDKSIDFKAKLIDESAYVPQLALGMIDFGGTGLFSSEYVVANKRFGNFDSSLGLAWGYLGSRGNIRNPLSKISTRFDTRSTDLGMGGTPAFKSFFHGPAAMFGGVQYHAPWSNWVIKAEYDGNNYRKEPQGNNQKQSLPFNFGLVYRPSPSIDLSVGVERGNTAMFALTLHTSASKLATPKVSDPPALKIHAARPQQDPNWTGTAADMVAMSQWGVINIGRLGSTLRVEMEGASGAHWNERIERIVSVLHRDAPAAIETFELVLTEQGVLLSERVIHRRAWVQQNTEFVPPSARVQSILAVEPSPTSRNTADQTIWTQTPAYFGYSIVPSWQQNIGGPDGFLLFRAGLSVPMQLKLANDLRLTAALNVNAFDNFGRFKYTAPSSLPRVRTYLREYMTDSRVNMSSLQMTHFGELAPNQYYSVYGGYLESMFAGVGGEWLYRAWHSPFAFGVDVNRVQQRNFDQAFGFDKAGVQTGYRVTTGHASVYWDTGWEDTRVKFSAGRYLAGDVGVTLDVGKTFNNGVSMGAWVTKTNVSAQTFGEGSFDKGMYLRIPFDVMATMRTGGVANLNYNPLTRDGGARLSREFTLYGQTTARSKRDTGFVPATTSLAPNGL